MRPDSLVAGASPLDRLDWNPFTLAAAAGILIFSWLASKILRRALSRAADRARIDVGVGYALGRLLHLAILVVGILLALNLLGVGLGNLAVIAGALGIGIGFGLQSIAANFVSGLVLLFERPIRVGDRVSLGTLEPDTVNTINGYVRAIKLRATTVVTPDNITLIVPNLEFVTKTVVNWSLGDLKMRIRLNIGVATDSDVDLVKRILDEVARAHAGTLKDPEPEIRMIATGDSALQFQLLVWIPDPRQRGRVESDLRWELVRRFREESVTIPFPRRDIRVYPGELVRSGEPLEEHEPV